MMSICVFFGSWLQPGRWLSLFNENAELLDRTLSFEDANSLVLNIGPL